MKIAVRGGHNYLATGCEGLINEVVEDRKVKDSVIKYLRQLGHTVLDVTPGNMDRDSDLIYGVNKANNWGADLFISIHFNKAYSSYNGAIGTEAWVYSTTDNYNDEEYAQRIVNTLGSLGFKNRGVKTSTGLYELKSTTMPSVIVEVCFVEATEDVALYKKLGQDKIGQTIAEAISNKKINTNNNVVEERKFDMKKIVTYYGDADLFSAVLVAQRW
ncbi:N-acetylmuramoyl-L-alanine amidase [Clostridium sp. DSM 100503]|uniref:N-acetylmuramoyl-L-alanine amidase n=1 Tax=Clostridium sp. DSM 100503 TaxID=2963282 RepID=UPI00214A2DBB|nr:N-acetylmuramoyl-L-alanine amidase [Clostridium sp. DSM 100503]MCR1953169.1 N-acetylmuramoyl-L-alanine amidase [Clostridium sp. DSM 100503]